MACNRTEGVESKDVLHENDRKISQSEVDQSILGQALSRHLRQSLFAAPLPDSISLHLSDNRPL